MNQSISYIYRKIELLNPLHYKKLKKNILFFNAHYDESTNSFFNKYISYLYNEKKTLDFAIDCYLKMISDVNVETIDFFRTGRYSSSTFDEVNARVYAKPEVMEYYMHGLILSQFLWKHHYQIFDFFISTLPNYKSQIKNYLEVGAGHGLYLSKALEILNQNTRFSVVDISNTSIELTKKFNDNDRVTFYLKDIFKFENNFKYDFITMGEVLEHVEEPLNLLVRLKELLNDDGVAFITTPTNAPAIDHIYLFNNVVEIQSLIKLAGYRIVLENSFLSEEVNQEQAEKLKITIMYGAFIKKQLNVELG